MEGRSRSPAVTDDFDMVDVKVRITERIATGFTDARAVWGTPHDPNYRSPPYLPPTPEDRRREAWAWIARQWEMWPRPDLMLAILPPPCSRPSRRSRP